MHSDTKNETQDSPQKNLGHLPKAEAGQDTPEHKRTPPEIKKSSKKSNSNYTSSDDDDRFGMDINDLKKR